MYCRASDLYQRTFDLYPDFGYNIAWHVERMLETIVQKMKNRKKNAEEIVYQKLKQAIVKRYIKQGSKLVEDTIARQVGVSRTPVRAAIKRLEMEGLASFIPNKGAVVIKPTLTEIEQTFAVRAHMEKMAAKLAAQLISKTQIDELQFLVKKEQKVFDDRNLENYYVVNTAFHLKIAEASGNKVLYDYIEQLLERTKIYLILFDPFFKFVINPSAAEHLSIVNALACHDSKKAGRSIEKHLKSALVEMETSELIPEDYIAL
jgi:DNA-binding GntR family transcriptional regulator